MDVGLTRFWRIARAVLLATAAAFALLWRGTPVAAQPAGTTCGTDLRVLVISADGAEPGLPAIRDALDKLGTPYDVYVAADQPGGLTPDRLSDTCRAFYQGVILTTDTLAPAGSSSSTLTPTEFQTLSSYESAFNIRQVTWFTHPTPELGFNDPEGPTADPVTAALTTAGAETFAYLNPSAAGVSIQSSQTYLATPLDAGTTPLLTDAAAHALAAIRVTADGRENLALTFDTTPGSPQALLLSYGIVNWVTRGPFMPVLPLTFDEIPFQAANGLTFGGVTFGFTVGSVPSTDANYNSPDGPPPGSTTYLDDHVLEGSAYGVLTLDFARPITSLQFGVAMDTDVAVPAGVTVQLIRSGGAPLSFSVDIAPIVFFSEALFTYSGDPITRAVLSFDPTSGTCAAGGNPVGRCAGGRFAIDNLQAQAIQPPTASAGPSQVVPSGVVVTLAGAATDPSSPPQPLSYVWTQIEGDAVTLTDANTLTPTFTAPSLVVGDSARILRFTLTASNSEWMTTSDPTTVTVTPPVGAPTANAGAPQTVEPGAAVTLSGTAADPNVPALPLTYAWTQTTGPLVTLTGATTATPSFTAPSLIPGDPPVTLTFSMTVSNGALAVTATTSVTVQVPAAVLTAVQTIYSDGTGNQTTAPFAANAGDLLVAFVSADAPGPLVNPAAVSGAGLSWTLVRRVTAQYGTSEVWSAFTPAALPAATVTATMLHQRPTSLTVVTFSGAGGIGASAGANATTGGPAVSVKTTKPGSLVYGVGNDWDRAVPRTPASGQTLVHQYLGPTNDSHWVQTFTAGAVSAAGTTVQLKDIAPTNDRWNFVGVEILLRNGQTSAIQPPIVNLGPASAVVAGAPVTLVAVATDPNVPARPLTYAWTQTAGDLVALTGAATPTLGFVAPVLMPWEETVTLGFSLTVSNGALVTSATTTIVVAPESGPLTAAQAVYSDGTGDQTTAPFAANAGDLLVAFVSSDAPGALANPATVSGAGLSWTLVRRVTAQYGTSEVWSAFTPTALPAATVTAVMTYQRPTSLTVVTFSGAGGIGASAGANATTGGPAVSVKTTKPGSLVYGVGNDWDRAVPRTPASGQTLVHQYLGPTNDSHWVQTFTAGAVSAAGTTVQLKDIAPTNDRWNFVGVEILTR